MRRRAASEPPASYRRRLWDYISNIRHGRATATVNSAAVTVEDLGRSRLDVIRRHVWPWSSRERQRAPAPPAPRAGRQPSSRPSFQVPALPGPYALAHRAVLGSLENKGFRATMFNRVMQRWSNRAIARLSQPKKLSHLEAAFLWLTVTLISFPWLSYILLLSFLKTKRKEKVQLTSSWANFLLTKIFKVRLSVEAPFEYGPPPHVYVALNQASLLETVLILPAALPTTSEVFLFANIEFLMIPLLGWVFWKSLGAEMVIRQNKRHAKRAVDRSVRRMVERNASVIISIEGKRSEKGDLSPFKKGPAVLALKTGATIVPIVIQGTREIWPYGTWRVGVGGDVKVKFLEGIPTKGLVWEDRHRIIEQLRTLADKETPPPPPRRAAKL